MNVTKVTGAAACLLAIVVLYLVVEAGDLEPPGPPAPTMVTLQQIYNLLLSQGGAVPKTGQTECWDASGTSIPCAGTGQDGEYQAGVSASPRFTDNGDGTVRDNLTGLTWLKDADCFGKRDWTTALSDANGLANGSCGLTDGSVAGNWRLPNIKELQSLNDFSQIAPVLPAGHPFSGVQSAPYWSSTTFMGVNEQDHSWILGIGSGDVDNWPKANTSDVWPVRVGQ